MKCFVTVGSTHFEDLVRAIDSDEVQCALRLRGFETVLVQIGE